MQARREFAEVFAVFADHRDAPVRERHDLTLEPFVRDVFGARDRGRRHDQHRDGPVRARDDPVRGQFAAHAGLCPVRGELAAHLVVAGEHGPVAVLVMPAAAVTRAEHVADEWFQGEIVPLAHGSVAVIGEHGENLGELAARVQQMLTLDADGV